MWCRRLRSRLKPERRIGDDVDPGRRRPLAGPQDGHVFSPVGREAAQPVEELEIGRGGGAAGALKRGSPLWRRLLGRYGLQDTIELVGQSAALRRQERPARPR